MDLQVVLIYILRNGKWYKSNIYILHELNSRPKMDKVLS
jgi:hypothetical protein